MGVLYAELFRQVLHLAALLLGLHSVEIGVFRQCRLRHELIKAEERFLGLCRLLPTPSSARSGWFLYVTFRLFDG